MGKKYMSKFIEEGDIVQVDFNGAQITLCRTAEVIHKPNIIGVAWVFKAVDTGFTYHVTEGCTISRKDR